MTVDLPRLVVMYVRLVAITVVLLTGMYLLTWVLLLVSQRTQNLPSHNSVVIDMSREGKNVTVDPQRLVAMYVRLVVISLDYC